MQVVISHINADFDSLACMFAITKLYPEAIPVFTGSPEPNVRHFLADHPHFAPRKERQINLNEISEIIVVDTPRKNRLANFEKLVDTIAPLLLVDHHPENEIDINAQKIINEPTGAAVTLIIDHFIEKGITVNAEEATLMMLAIYEDTGLFCHTRTKSKDFLAMAYLMHNGADIRYVNKYLQYELNSEQFALLSKLSTSLISKDIRGLSIYFAFTDHPGYLPDVSVIVQKLKRIYDLSIIFVGVRMGNRLYLVARADESTIDCGKVLEYWQGGGHPTAAAASIQAETSFQEIEEQITRSITDQISQTLSIRHIMSFPVESISAETKIKEARRRIMQLHHNALIVYNADGSFQGMVHKDDLDRAFHHHLVDAPISDFVTTDMITVDPLLSIQQFKGIIARTLQRKFPVIENGKIIGIVTANDLLNSVVSGFGDQQDKKENFKYSIDNLMPLLVKRFDSSTLELFHRIGETAIDLGFSAYLVGGCVRDLLLERVNEDIDIVIEGDAIDVARRFVSQYGGHYKTHTRFHTAKLSTGPTLTLDLASARIELYEQPAALPLVEKSSLRHDLYRRDFSLNTLAISLSPQSFGRLLDYFSGRRDISLGIIRVLHNVSFIEDPTRIIRAVRFEQRFGFKIAEQTLKLIETAIRHKVINQLTPKRLREELEIILHEKNPLKPLYRLNELGILQQFPISLSLQAEQIKLLEHINSFVQWHRMVTKSQVTRYWLVFLFGLLQRHTASEIQFFFQHFSFSERIRQLFKRTHQSLETLNLNLNNPEMKNSAIYLQLKEFPIETILFFLGYFETLIIRRHLLLYLTELQSIKIQTTGEDLIAWGLKPGPYFRQILDEILVSRLDNLFPINQEKEFAQELTQNIKKNYIDNC